MTVSGGAGPNNSSETAGAVVVEHDGCDLCEECPGCDGGSGATPRNPFFDVSRPGVVLLGCLDCDSSGYVCPTVPR